MGKKNLFTVLSISTALLVGTGSAYATQIQKNESEKAVQIVNKESNETTKQEVKVQESEKSPFSFTDEAFFTRDGQPDYFANEFLNNQDLFSLLNMNGAELKQELAIGKSVVEIAASKNVSTQQVIEVIAKAQTIVQIQGEENGEVPANTASMKQLLKNIEPKVLHVIEHKSN
ncbi:hypothetical protein [Lysinibacillus sp. NPDC092081]|uniref:hypothetical protein n=1 Tax=Lysinibacillus sp. NPDC092081 TaxID=3364131 RepID=UPI00381D6558